MSTILNWLIAIFTIIFIVVFIAVLSGCKTSRTVTVTKTEFDSTAIHQRDSLSLSIKELIQKHELDIEAIKNTGVTFQPNCDTIIFPPNYNYDSMMAVIGKLRNKVTIGVNGEITAEGKLAGAYSNMSNLSHELTVIDSINQQLELRHESDSLAIKNLTASEHSVSKSKPGGIFQAWWLLPVGLLVGYAVRWRTAK